MELACGEKISMRREDKSSLGDRVSIGRNCKGLKDDCFNCKHRQNSAC